MGLRRRELLSRERISWATFSYIRTTSETLVFEDDPGQKKSYPYMEKKGGKESSLSKQRKRRKGVFTF